MRRLLLIPAAALVLVGTPVLALQQPDPGAATPGVTDVPLPSTQGTTVEPGFVEEVPIDANLVGVTWEGDPAAEFAIEVQDAAGTWTAATEVAPVDVAPDDASRDAVNASTMPREASEPLWVGDSATAVRVTVESGGATNVAVAAVGSAAPVAPSGSAGALGWLPRVDGPQRWVFAIALLGVVALLAALALGWSPWRRSRSRRVVAVTMLAAVALAACQPLPPPPPPPPPPAPAGDQPPIVGRGSWGARPFSCAGGPEITNPLTFSVVHHTVNSNGYGSGESAGIVNSIQAYHQGTLGFCDIGYNFLIDRFGVIFEGRAGGVTQAVLGAHTGGFNTRSTGAALIGDFTGQQPTSQAWEALVRLLRWKLGVHGVNRGAGFSTTSAGGGSNYPAGTVVSYARPVIWHRTVWPTACPGNTLAGAGPEGGRIWELRDRVAA
jgi:N-acetylmuramoyl-L-alanine amidase